MAGLGFLKAARSLAIMAKNRRAFGSAAALSNDYDDDYYYDYHDDRTARARRDQPMVDGQGSEPRRGVQWVIIGEPGTRKHVYAEWLSKLLEVPHISMGTLVRQELSPHGYLYKQGESGCKIVGLLPYVADIILCFYNRGKRQGAIEKIIENAVNQGKLVPEDVVFGLLSKKLEEGYSKVETGFILDGIPRTRMQAEILDRIADVDLVLNFKCAGKDLAKHELGNGLNLQSQGSWIRSFPEAAAWKEKLQTYAEQSKPLEDYYRKQNKLLDFQVSGAPGETWQGLLSVLQLQHMNSSFQKLTA